MSSFQSGSTQSSLRRSFAHELKAARARSLQLISQISSEQLKQQAHPDFSPIGWHLGHIAYTESLWTAEHLTDKPCEFPQYTTLFAADGLPKSQRENLPDLQEILAYMASVRQQTIETLHTTKPDRDESLWHWLLQHESQHAETIAIILALHQLKNIANQPKISINDQEKVCSSSACNKMLTVAAGGFTQGCDHSAAIDNERPAHAVWLDSYQIDRMPVTYEQYRQFIAAGGYEEAQWWTEEGWAWKLKAKVRAPLYSRYVENSRYVEGAYEQASNQAVYGVSWYEADAYARFVGKRLPTESEWERAAQLTGETMLGNVWEWTDSWFEAYPGFQPFPYAGYSQRYFDRSHRVLRGGSFATPRWALRKSFRNWYHPHQREMFAGFRCAI